MWPPEGSGDSTGLLPGLGDSNTYFFHKKTQQRRQKNIVTSIQNNSRQPLEMIYEIKEEVVHDFEQDFQQSGEGDCEEEEKEMLENMQIIISDSENSQLTKEIKKLNMQCGAWTQIKLQDQMVFQSISTNNFGS